MAKLTAQEIATRIAAANAEKREPMPMRPERVAATAAVRRLNAIIERRARGF